MLKLGDKNVNFMLILARLYYGRSPKLRTFLYVNLEFANFCK